MDIFKKLKAQQLVEFLLVAPFIVIILGILTEYAYALNVDMTLNTGLKSVTSSIYSEIKPNMTRADIKKMVQDHLSDYMKQNNAPVQSDNELKVDYLTIGQNAVFTATYKYLSAFTLPNVYFHVLPDEFNFCATAPVPAAFLKSNNYDAINSEKLDIIWSSSADFSSLDSFNASKIGIMNNSITGSSDTGKMAFLLPANGTKYYIIRWNGDNWSNDNNAPWVADLSDGSVSECDKTLTTCLPKPTNIMGTLGGSITSVILYSDIGTTVPVCNKMILDITCWISSTERISDKTEDGVLKQALALNTAKLNSGNYDDINVLSYNPGASAGNSYKADTFGSLVIVHPTGTSIAKLIDATASAPSTTFANNFGAKF